MRRRYNAVNFLQYIYKIHLIASSPARARYGAPVVSFKSDPCSAAVITVLCEISR